MPVTINGNGNIAGVSVGGLPDGSVDADTLAANAVTSAKVASAAITSTGLHDDAVTTSKLPSGTIVQVKTVVNDSDQYWANATDWVDISGLSISITPKASTNILLMRGQVKFATAHNGDNVASLAIKNDGSLLSYNIYNSGGYGDFHYYFDANDDSLGGPQGTFERAVTAGSTSSQTYQVVHRPGSSSWSGQNMYINRSNRSDNDWYNCYRVRSTFRIMEIAA